MIVIEFHALLTTNNTYPSVDTLRLPIYTNPLMFGKCIYHNIFFQEANICNLLVLFVLRLRIQVLSENFRNNITEQYERAFLKCRQSNLPEQINIFPWIQQYFNG